MNSLNPAAEKVNEKVAEKRRALGRGLDSLLPGPRAVAPAAPTVPVPALPQTAGRDDASAEVLESVHAVARTPDGETVYELHLDKIRDNPHQTRVSFDAHNLGELAASIQVQGVLQPIVVRPAERGDFILILGERRMRASRMAGKATIPAIVKRVSEQQAAEMTLVENLQRKDLDCLEQAAAFSFMSLRFHLTQEQIGQRVGVSREQVSNYLRLLKLPGDVLQHIRDKTLSYSHARLLLRLESDDAISTVARQAVEKRMSVAQLEDEVARLIMPGMGAESGNPDRSAGARWMDPNVRAAQRGLESALGMRVRIRDRNGKGKITIEYGTLEDFDRVVKMLQRK